MYRICIVNALHQTLYFSKNVINQEILKNAFCVLEIKKEAIQNRPAAFNRMKYWLEMPTQQSIFGFVVFRR